MRGTIHAIPLLAALMLIVAGFPSAGATPPCPALDYSVDYDSSVWYISLFPHSPLQLQTAFYFNGTYPWTKPTVSLLESRPWEPITFHLEGPASATRPVVFQDLDGDAKISRLDQVQVWDPVSSHDYFYLGWGRNATSIGDAQGFKLQDNYQYVCRNAWPIEIAAQTMAQSTILVIAVTAVPVVMGLFLRLKSHRAPQPTVKSARIGSEADPAILGPLLGPLRVRFGTRGSRTAAQ